jgi:hypothetical protein
MTTITPGQEHRMTQIEATTRDSLAVAHTPGPWKVDFDSPDSAGVIAPDQNANEDNRVVVAHGIAGPNFKANAALIAAAPELLEALKDAEDSLSYAQECWIAKDGTSNTVLERRRRTVSAAIAKAENMPPPAWPKAEGVDVEHVQKATPGT